ncbi:hypothetical protein Mgra_00004715 [Meloidogyne graminicola]|uniref:Uncharacterized protein n=1 Tax=Meloidogyne graminicola TaxID=189291 RepID=A0A8S9ZRI8_9BILA|nr:hypothetical protein Mgra_00004715 [Meloidogyne graminicola]
MYLFTINMVVDQLGIPFFLIVVYVTIKYKTLHGICHKLIGIYAVCCILSKIQIIPPWLVMITNIQIPLWLCALTDTIPIAGSFNIYSLMFMIAVDRISSMYSIRGDSFHLPLMYGISSLFPLTFIIFVFINVIQDPKRLNSCCLEDLLTKEGQKIFHNACLIFNLITLICYILMILKVIWDINKGKINNLKLSLFKSLTIIMGIQIFGYLFSLIFYNLIDKGIFDNLNETQKPLIVLLINCISSLSTTSEVPALFLSSTEHRNALKKIFGFNTLNFQPKIKKNILENKKIIVPKLIKNELIIY